MLIWLNGHESIEDQLDAALKLDENKHDVIIHHISMVSIPIIRLKKDINVTS